MEKKSFLPLVFSIIFLLGVRLHALDLVTFDYPPIMGKSNYSEQGVLLEIVQEAFNSQGITLDLIFLPVQRAINKIRHGSSFLMVGLKEYFENTDSSNLSFIPLMKVNFTFFYMKENYPQGFIYSSPEALGKTSIGVLRNGVTHIQGQKLSLQVDTGTDLHQVFTKLYNHRTSLALAIDLAGWEMIHKLYPEKATDFAFDGENPFISLTAYAILNQNYPEYKKYADIFEEGLRTIIANGTWNRIVARYYHPENIPQSSIQLMDEYYRGHWSNTGKARDR